MDETQRVKWSAEATKCFLDTCIEERNKIGRKGLSLHKDSWSRVQKKLEEVCGMTVTKRQMKNNWEYLKGKYKAWVYLRNKTGNVYNEQTNSFSFSNEDWEEIIKVCSMLIVFRFYISMYKIIS